MMCSSLREMNPDNSGLLYFQLEDCHILLKKAKFADTYIKLCVEYLLDKIIYYIELRLLY